MFSGAIVFNHSLGNWDIRSVTTLVGMLDNSNLSVDNYDATLMGWKNNENLRSYVTFGALNLEYCNAEPERWYLISAKNWTINGDAKQSSCQAGLVPFITTWDAGLTGSSISFPLYHGEAYNYDVDWESDGVWDDIGVQGSISHIYTSGGNKRVSIRGVFPRIYFLLATGQESQLLEINQWGTISWRSMNNAFEGASRLKVLATDAPDLTYVTDLSSMFRNCDSFNESINHWDVTTITDMNHMFAGAYTYDKPLDNWEVKNVTTMAGMFFGGVINSSGFGRSDFDQDISGWNVEKVEDMTNMFAHASTFNRNLTAWNVANVKDMRGMFWAATSFNGDLLWGNKTANVTNMSRMFCRARDFNKDISGWDVSKVTDMGSMFAEATIFDQPLNAWGTKTPLVTDMGHMFSEASNFDRDISGWDVGNVTDMWSMFYRATNFDQDLGQWDVKNVEFMYWMLSYSGLSTTNYENTLNGWAALHTITPLQQGVTLGAIGRSYCDSSGRDILTNSTAPNWTIQGDDVSPWCSRTLSTEQFKTEPYVIYPNPADDRIFISGLSKTLDNVNIQIIDISGRTVLHVKNQDQIDVSSLKAGVYFVQILGERQLTSKLIKM
jgi:surface protein